LIGATIIGASCRLRDAAAFGDLRVVFELSGPCQPHPAQTSRCHRRYDEDYHTPANDYQRSSGGRQLTLERGARRWSGYRGGGRKNGRNTRSTSKRSATKAVKENLKEQDIKRLYLQEYYIFLIIYFKL
jgi:hypothetical protein